MKDPPTNATGTLLHEWEDVLQALGRDRVLASIEVSKLTTEWSGYVLLICTYLKTHYCASLLLSSTSCAHHVISSTQLRSSTETCITRTTISSRIIRTLKLLPEVILTKFTLAEELSQGQPYPHSLHESVWRWTLPVGSSMTRWAVHTTLARSLSYPRFVRSLLKPFVTLDRIILLPTSPRR